MGCKVDSLRNSVREVSRSRNMRSPDFSVGLCDWELTMVAVRREDELEGGNESRPGGSHKRARDTHESGSEGRPLFVI